LFVTLRTGARSVALAVDQVIGIQEVRDSALCGLPSLIRSGAADLIEAIGVLDRELLFLLDRSIVLPESVWDLIKASADSTQ
jgi:chemotaxis signal transduction protein